MAVTGRIGAIASAFALCLLWGSAVSAATIIAGPGTPETLIHDARLTVSSSRAVGRSLPPAPVRQGLLGRVTTVAGRAGCLVAGTSAASAVGSSVGYLWSVKRCLGPDRKPSEPLDIASLFLPPPPAPAWPLRGAPLRLADTTAPAPIPAPAAGATLPVALGVLLLARRKRR